MRVLIALILSISVVATAFAQSDDRAYSFSTTGSYATPKLPSKAFTAVLDKTKRRLNISAIYKNVTIRVYNWQPAKNTVDQLDEVGGWHHFHEYLVMKYDLRASKHGYINVSQKDVITVEFVNPSTKRRETVTIQDVPEPDDN